MSSCPAGRAAERRAQRSPAGGCNRASAARLRAGVPPLPFAIACTAKAVRGAAAALRAAGCSGHHRRWLTRLAFGRALWRTTSAGSRSRTASRHRAFPCRDRRGSARAGLGSAPFAGVPYAHPPRRAGARPAAVSASGATLAAACHCTWRHEPRARYAAASMGLGGDRRTRLNCCKGSDSPEILAFRHPWILDGGPLSGAW